MSIVNTKSMLDDALNGQYAVGAFNIENMEFAQAVIEAAIEMNSPVILATSVNTLKYASPSIFFSIVNALSENANVPVAIHLDHGESLDDLMNVITSGYKSIMIDGSANSYIDNVNLTRKATDICHPLSITVEGELGAIGGKPNISSNIDFMYTNPETAVDFVRQTNVDSLAVAIGTSHGLYKDKPNLDYKRLQKIRECVNVPLVLHGASGLTDIQISECVKCGINKINIATELRIAWTKTMRLILSNDFDKYDPKIASKMARQAVKEVVKGKISIIGSEGKAK